MPQSYECILLHVVFSTKSRRRVLHDPIRGQLHAYLGGICRSLSSRCIAAGGTENHVHLLCGMNRQTTAADLVRQIKVGSSKWLKAQGCDGGKFAWQNGYGAFSVKHSQVPDVVRYITGQVEHHRTKSFQEEFVEFLEACGIEYDERYIWE